MSLDIENDPKYRVTPAMTHGEADNVLFELADKLREYYRDPGNLKRPANVEIVQMPNAIKSRGVFFLKTTIPGAKKLEVGEVMTVDLDDPRTQSHLAKGRIQIVDKPATRPFIYDSSKDAKWSSRAYRRVKPDDPRIEEVQSKLSRWSKDWQKTLSNVSRSIVSVTQTTVGDGNESSVKRRARG